ncbi:tripartite tricarboxylate transporter TctB family protein [Qingshengfaniella alkalisoli]|uniref:Tripartite tricarboxylate transporter TctB family protein n=1 Tax=Qingshengfaniella alkalisoli TaxID=2599296 RepID=A0A5B8IAU6_9RHOB|nr:tripartite tricarboxylate transporter TctB family protein [Qingshengfaniella alkalisoli]QDY71179.1 tripartite tricarboxylate transporter TctB family protein [Qingshengfaniella alkalisoli]
MFPTKIRYIVPLFVAIAIAIFAIGWSFTFAEVPPMLIRGFQPAAFPRLVAGLIVILSMMVIFRTARGGEILNNSTLDPAYFRTLVILGVFAAMAGLGDFLLALMVGTAGISVMWGERRPLILIGLGIVAPVLVILLFDLLFQVRFPRGFLIDLYYG